MANDLLPLRFEESRVEFGSDSFVGLDCRREFAQEGCARLRTELDGHRVQEVEGIHPVFCGLDVAGLDGEGIKEDCFPTPAAAAIPSMVSASGPPRSASSRTAATTRVKVEGLVMTSS